jgi:hypothetical protein
MGQGRYEEASLILQWATYILRTVQNDITYKTT